MSGALELALRDLAAWSLQVGVLALAAAALSRLLPIDRPAARLALDQALLASVLGLPLLQPWHATASGDVVWSLAHVSDSVPSPGPASTAASSWGAAGWPFAVAALLLLGVAFHLARLGAGLLRLRRLRRSARPLDAAPWLCALCDEVAPRARLLLCEATGTPATCGLRRPVVLLPPAFEAMVRERQESVALHELIHARRGDWLTLMLEELLKAVLYFHPAVHWLVGRVRLAREQAVDAAVVEHLGAREAYLDSLLEVALSAARARAVPAAPFLHQRHLRERVDLLLKGAPMSRVRTLAHAALTAAALVLVVSWAVAAAPLQAPAPAPAAGSPAREAPGTPLAEPKLVHRIQPGYPPEAKAEKVQGIFLIDIRCGKDGAVEDARVVASAPNPERLEQLEAKRGTPAGLEGDQRLAEAALAAVKQWRYEPILKGGQPVEFKLTVTVRFRLS
jgi:beta-lactamase regulating signal transducer with metallopeptidase domain